MPTKILRVRETTLHFVPAGATQAEDEIFETDNLASGNGVQSGQHSIGAAAATREFAWRAFQQFQATPVVGDAFRYYVKTAGDSGVHPDNDDGTSAGAVSDEDKLNNLQQIGAIVVDEANANIEMVASGRVWIDADSVQIVGFNGTTVATTTDEDENGFTLTPVVDEIQD